jgi:NADH dehydrogenase
MTAAASQADRRQVVVVGAGFGGLQAVRALSDAPVDVLVIDRVNHHLFQPLLYQVATGLLAPGDIAPTLRSVLAKQANARVLLGDVTHIDPIDRRVEVVTVDGQKQDVSYDDLVVAAGAEPSYFGHDDWGDVAPAMKTLQNAVTIRDKVLTAFETAAATTDPDTRRAWLTFVVVGAGPTGVELAGQVAALVHRTVDREFDEFTADDVRIVLVDAGPHVLGPFKPSLRRSARRTLDRLGVEMMVHRAAKDITADGVLLAPIDDQSGQQRIAAKSVLWTAGVAPSPLAKDLETTTGATLDHAGKVVVRDDCSIAGHDELFVIGDLANVHDLPGLAEPAMQEGKFVGKVIADRVSGQVPKRQFKYRDLGMMATIAPREAVTQIGPIAFGGLLGKAAWAVVHVGFLVGWGNRLAVLIDWAQLALRGARRQRAIISQTPQH